MRIRDRWMRVCSMCTCVNIYTHTYTVSPWRQTNFAPVSFVSPEHWHKMTVKECSASLFSSLLFSSHICSYYHGHHNRSTSLTPPFSFINEINSVYQCIKVHTFMQYLFQKSTRVMAIIHNTCTQTHTQICELLYSKVRLFVFFAIFAHIYRLVCVSFLINRLNS